MNKLLIRTQALPIFVGTNLGLQLRTYDYVIRLVIKRSPVAFMEDYSVHLVIGINY